MTIDLGRFATLFSGYTELRVQENSGRRVLTVNGDVVANDSMRRGGVSARVWRDGVWGFASDADSTAGSVERVVGAATDNARYLGTRVDKSLGRLPPVVGSSTNTFAPPKTDGPTRR